MTTPSACGSKCRRLVRVTLRRGIERLGQPKIQHLDGAVSAHLDVGRLQVAMNDPLLMRGLQRLRDLLGDRQRLVDRDRALGDSVRQRRPLD